MAQLQIRGGEVIFRCNPLERLLDLRRHPLRMPVGAITQVSVVHDALNRLRAAGVTFGYAADSAPNRRILAVSSRGRYNSRPPAQERSRTVAVALYLNRPAVWVDFDSTGPWQTWVVSNTHAETIAAHLQRDLTTEN